MEKFDMGKVNSYISLERKGLALTSRERAYLEAYRLMLEEKSKPVFRRPKDRIESATKSTKRILIKDDAKKDIENIPKREEKIIKAEEITEADTKEEE